MRLFSILAIVSAAAPDAAAQTARPLPWRIGAPEVVWRPPSALEYGPDIQQPVLQTLTIHPEGGVLALVSHFSDGARIVRIDRTGLEQWHWQGSDLSAVSYLRSGDGIHTVLALGQALVRLDAHGRLLWALHPKSAGMASFDSAVLRQIGDDVLIAVGGEALDPEVPETGWEPRRATVAAVSGAGDVRWHASLPPSRRPDGLRRPMPDRGDFRACSPVGVPLRVLDDGGVLVLSGCNRWEIPYPGLAYGAPGRGEPRCRDEPADPIVRIDRAGNLQIARVRGNGRPGRFDLAVAPPPFIMRDGAPQPTAIAGQEMSPSYPEYESAVLWFGSTAARVHRYIASDTAFVDMRRCERKGGADPAILAMPAADVVEAGNTIYLVRTRPDFEAGRLGAESMAVQIVAVEPARVRLMARRSLPAMFRLRYSPVERALYGMQDGAIVRLRIDRTGP